MLSFNGNINKITDRVTNYQLKLICIIFFLIAIRNNIISGQDPQFSQFYSNPLYLAPSFAGGAESNRINACYRHQWFNLPVKFIAYSFSYDFYSQPFNSGLGFLFVKDYAGSGELGVTSVGIQYSYNFQVIRGIRLRPGLHFSYLEHGVAYNKLKFIDQVMFDTPTSTSFVNPLDRTRDVDLSLSLLGYSKRIWLGITADHLLRPNISLYADKYRLPLKFYYFGGVEILRRGRLLKPLDETVTIAFMLKHQEYSTQLDLGVYWHKNPLVLGLWYRGLPPFNSQRGDAFIILLGYKTPHFNIGYSYDITISNLISHAIGSHEITATVKFLMPRKKKMGQIPCPEF